MASDIADNDGQLGRTCARAMPCEGFGGKARGEKLVGYGRNVVVGLPV